MVLSLVLGLGSRLLFPRWLTGSNDPLTEHVVSVLGSDRGTSVPSTLMSVLTGSVLVTWVIVGINWGWFEGVLQGS